jgi:hypothetical protein
MSVARPGMLGPQVVDEPRRGGYAPPPTVGPGRGSAEEGREARMATEGAAARARAPQAIHPWVAEQERRVRFGVFGGPTADWPALRAWAQELERLGRPHRSVADDPRRSAESTGSPETVDRASGRVRESRHVRLIVRSSDRTRSLGRAARFVRGFFVAPPRPLGRRQPPAAPRRPHLGLPPGHVRLQAGLRAVPEPAPRMARAVSAGRAQTGQVRGTPSAASTAFRRTSSSLRSSASVSGSITSPRSIATAIRRSSSTRRWQRAPASPVPGRSGPHSSQTSTTSPTSKAACSTRSIQSCGSARYRARISAA